MKKILSLAVFVLFSLSIVACSSSKATPSPSAPSASASSSPAPAATSAQPETPEPSTDNVAATGTGVIGDHVVKILGYELTKDYEGKPAAIVSFEWTNNSDKAASFMFSLDSTVFQNGVECESAIIMSNDAYSAEDLMKEIKPGTTFTVKKAFALQDNTSPIEVEVTELISFESNPPMVKQNFDIAK